jgi:hypothetical protein
MMRAAFIVCEVLLPIGLSAIFVFVSKSNRFNSLLDRAIWLLLALEASSWALMPRLSEEDDASMVVVVTGSSRMAGVD